METFELRGKDGTTYEVRAPNAEAALAAFKKMQGAGQTKELSWTDVPAEAARNFTKSGGQFLSNLAYPFTNPSEFAGGVKDLAVGVGSKVVAGADTVGQAIGLPKLPRTDPETRAINERGADAVGQFFKDRYGSMDAIKNTLATDPVGALADTAGVLYGGGATLPGKVSVAGWSIPVGNAVKTAGSVVDPIKNVGRAAKLTGRAGAEVLGKVTGAQAESYLRTFKGARRGSETLWDNLQGTAPLDDAASRAGDAVGELVKQRSNQYQAWNPLPGATQRINTAKLDKAVADGVALGSRQLPSGQTVVVDKATAAVMEEIKDIVNTYKANGLTSPADLDQLKQIIYDRSKLALKEQGSRASKAAMDVYHAIGNELKDQVPGYAQTMKDYGKASDLIKEMRRELSINDKATAGTKLRKLQSAMRNTATTANGYRTKLVDQLAAIDPEIPEALAGQALNSWGARGMQGGVMGGVLGGGAGAYAAMTNPGAAALAALTLPLTSPRITGTAVYGLGKAARGVDKVGARSPVTAQQAAQAIMLGQLLSRSAQVPAEE